MDNNWIENQIRPIAIGRANWLFAGSLRAGQRAAAVMSLVQSARMNGHGPYAYLQDVLTRLPTHKANVADVVEGNSLLHGQETDGFGDAGYQGVHKRPDARAGVTWHIAMRPGKRKELDKEHNPVDALIDQVEKIKASIRAKVEHPFRVIKRQFGYVKVRYRGVKKNTLQLKTLFALSNLWMVRHQLLGAQG